MGRIIAILLISALIGVGAYIFCSGRLDVREIIPRLSSLISQNGNSDGNIIIIKPNRSLPTTLLSEHQSVDDSERFKLKTTEENMLNLPVGENNHLCFEAQCSEYPIEPVYLFRIDTGENIGQMRDDGEGEDKKKGDGIFTLSFNIYASEYGRIEYIARNEESSSNQITIHLYELPNETNEAIIEELSSGVKAAILSYTDLEGFIKEESRQDAISAVVSYIESQYLNGTVSEYAISEYSVSYRDSATGLCVLYEPAVKGNLSSSGIAQMLLCHPHSSHDYGEGQLPPESLQQLLEYYNENLGYSTIEYPDERATPDFFTSIPKKSILIWYGHGAWCPWLVPFSFNFTSRPVLVTNQQYSFEYRLDHIDDFLTGRLGKSEGKTKLVYVAPEYIDKYCGDISGSFICLLSCHSGQNSRLVDSFLKKGAEAVVGFSDTVSAAYGSEFLKYLFYYMANKGDNNDIFYMTLGDADEASKADLGNDDREFWDKVNHIRIENGEEPYSRSFPKSGPARPVIFGNRDLSLAPSSTHEFSPMPTLMPTPEVSIATSYASNIEYLSQIYPFSFERYENNEGDSCVYNLDGKGLPGIANEYTRYGNQGIDGTTYNNGFEVWLARWNYTPEMSWVQTTYQLNGQFSSLSGKTGLIQSYNTTNFNTTVYFYDGERQLASYTLTPDNCNYDISVNLQGVDQLTLRVQDNVAVAGGTSYALSELKLNRVGEDVQIHESADNLSDVYAAYLKTLQDYRDVILNYNQRQNNPVQRVIAVCDIYGDSVPELLFAAAPSTDTTYCTFAILTYENGAVKPIYFNKHFDSLVAGGSHYFFFQMNGDKTLYHYDSNGDSAMTYMLDRMEMGASGTLEYDRVLTCTQRPGEPVNGQRQFIYSYENASGEISSEEFIAQWMDIMNRRARIVLTAHADSELLLGDISSLENIAMTYNEAIAFLSGRDLPQKGSDWNSAYREYVMNRGFWNSASPQFYSQETTFGLYDMNRDGTPELIAYNGSPDSARASDYVFTYSDGNIVYLGDAGFRNAQTYHYSNQAYPGIFCRSGNSGWLGTYYYHIENGAISNELVLSESNQGRDLNDYQVTKETANDALYQLALSDAKIEVPRIPLEKIEQLSWERFVEYCLGMTTQDDSFSILGSWKSIGDEGFGQAQPGMITVFEGDHCNFYSPYDTFQFYKNSNGQYQLDVTSFLFGEKLSFDVKIIDNNNIEIDNGIILTRFRRTDFEVKFADVVESIGALSEVDDSNYQSIFGNIGQSIDNLIGLYGRE